MRKIYLKKQTGAAKISHSKNSAQESTIVSLLLLQEKVILIIMTNLIFFIGIYL